MADVLIPSADSGYSHLMEVVKQKLQYYYTFIADEEGKEQPASIVEPYILASLVYTGTYFHGGPGAQPMSDRRPKRDDLFD